MKLKYLFSTVLASAVLFGGCVKNDPVGSFDNVQLDKTYLSISDKGGSAELTVTATENWQFVINDIWPDVVTFAKDESGKTYKAKYDEFGNLVNPDSEIESKTPSWLKATVLKGESGETKITFSAEGTNGGRELEIALYAGNNKQFLRVRQGSMEAQTATCAEVATAPDGKTFRLKGVCTSIENFEYGNWYIKDATGEMYIYGTLDSKGATKNFKSIGLEVGDEVEIEGPKGSYKGNPQLVNVTVLSLKKSLLKLVTESVSLPKDASELNIKIAYKGNGVFPAVPKEFASWITYVGMDHISGVPSKLEPNPCDTALVKFNIAANNAGARDGFIKFSSHSGSNKSEVTYNFSQEGSILPVSIEEFLAAEVASTVYKVTGFITEIKDLSPSDKYNNVGVTIRDSKGNTLYIHRMKPGEGGKVEELGIEVGDQLTVTGQRGEYNGSSQMVNGVYESHVHYNTVSIEDFLAAPVSDDVMYRVTGTISNIEDISASFKNATLTIKSASGTELYVFRMKPSDGLLIEEIGLTVGDELTVVGKRGEYKGKQQLVSGYYDGHVDK